jgi:hypothetical protein
MARDFDRQVAELQVRAAILNRFTRLGTPTTMVMPKSVWGWGTSRTQLICAIKPCGSVTGQDQPGC